MCCLNMNIFYSGANYIGTSNHAIAYYINNALAKHAKNCPNLHCGQFIGTQLS